MSNKEPKGETLRRSLVISAPNFQTAAFPISNEGRNSPYVQNKFSHRAKMEMIQHQEAGSSARTPKKNRPPKDFNKLYTESAHQSHEGWYGIPAPAFRNAMIAACKLVNFKMTIAKLSIFIVSDGYDPDDGTPLVRIEGEPRRVDSAVRNASGVIDIRPRPQWDAWKANLRIEFDGDQFRVDDIANLLARAGMQVGVGAGRNDSKASNGMGWGSFGLVAS